MFLSRQPTLTAAAPSRKPLPQDTPPMHAPAKPLLPPCRRPHRWHLRVAKPRAAFLEPSLAPA